MCQRDRVSEKERERKRERKREKREREREREKEREIEREETDKLGKTIRKIESYFSCTSHIIL